jgi:transcriptional regulator with XRE-family HTH domain
LNLIELSETFKSARLAARLTQQEVAKAAGVGAILVSRFERAALTEMGAVKLMALLRAVGLELYTRPPGQQRTLNDIARELDAEDSLASGTSVRRRVRHARGRA